MGKKDLWQSDYFDNKERFADMINGAFFKGEQVISAEELEEVDSKLVHHEKNEEAVSVIRDKVYRWRGQNVSICVLENQSYVDYRMVFRVMLEEAVSYIKQQKRVYRKWKEAGYSFDKNEFLSQMRKEEKYTPVITLILYLETEQEWDGAKSLYEILEIDEEWKPFVTNHKMNLFDYHEYEDFSFFKTENRIIFELLSCAKDEIKMEKIIKKNQYILDKETIKAILGMLGIKVNLNKIRIKTQEGVRYDMCKAWDDHKESGRREGRREGRQEGRQEGLQEGLISLVNILSTIFSDFDTIYNKIISDKKYQNVTREQVEKYYYAK